MSHRRVRGVRSTELVDEEYDNIPHTLVSQLSEEKEAEELNNIDRCYGDVTTVDIQAFTKCDGGTENGVVNPDVGTGNKGADCDEGLNIGGGNDGPTSEGDSGAENGCSNGDVNKEPLSEDIGLRVLDLGDETSSIELAEPGVEPVVSTVEPITGIPIITG